MITPNLYELLVGRVKAFFHVLLGAAIPRSISVTTDDSFSMKKEDLNMIDCDSDLIATYKQRGLYKDNPDFIVTAEYPYRDVVEGYIRYTDGVKSPVYELPIALLGTYFRKLP